MVCLHACGGANNGCEWSGGGSSMMVVGGEGVVVAEGSGSGMM